MKLRKLISAVAATAVAAMSFVVSAVPASAQVITGETKTGEYGDYWEGSWETGGLPVEGGTVTSVSVTGIIPKKNEWSGFNYFDSKGYFGFSYNEGWKQANFGFEATNWETLAYNTAPDQQFNEETGEFTVSLNALSLTPWGDSISIKFVAYQEGTEITLIKINDKVVYGTDPNASTDEPGTDEPGTDTPGTDDPGTDNPGTDDPGTDDPGTDNPGTDDPGTDEPSQPTSGDASYFTRNGLAWELTKFELLNNRDAVIEITYTDANDGWGDIGFGFSEGEAWRSHAFSNPAGTNAVFEVTVAEVLSECGVTDPTAVTYGKIEGYNEATISKVAVRAAAGRNDAEDPAEEEENVVARPYVPYVPSTNSAPASSDNTAPASSDNTAPAAPADEDKQPEDDKADDETVDVEPADDNTDEGEEIEIDDDTSVPGEEEIIVDTTTEVNAEADNGQGNVANAESNPNTGVAVSGLAVLAASAATALLSKKRRK